MGARRAFVVEVEFPDDEPDYPEIQYVQDTLGRVDRYIPGGVKVVSVAYFPHDLTPEARIDDPKSLIPESTLGTAHQSIPFDQPEPTAQPSAPTSDEATGEPKFAYPKVALPGDSPVATSVLNSPTPAEPPLPIKLNRELLTALQQGAFNRDVADWFRNILASMPTDQQDVLISAEFWQ